MNQGTKNTDQSLFHYILISIGIFVVCALPIVLDLELALIGFLALGIGGFIIIVSRFKLPYANILFLLIALSILTPPLQISTGLPRIRLDELLIYGIFPLILTFNFKTTRFEGPAKTFLTLYSVFIGCVLLSTVYGKVFLSVPVGTRDFFEIITILKYALLFATVYTFRIDLSPKKILYFILAVILISGFFGLTLYFGTLGFDRIFGELYLQDRVHIIDDRLTGTYKNPNTYSAILVFGHIIGLTLFLLESRPGRKPVILAGLLLISMFMLFAGSRTMIVGYLIATVLVFILASYKSDLSKKQLVLILTSLGIGIMVTVSFLSYEIMIRLQSGIDVLSDESFALRVLAWYLNIQLFLQSPVIGWGPAKDMVTTIVDNEYILMLRRYGVVGLIAFLSFYLYPLRIAFRKFRSSTMEADSTLHIVMICTICTFLLANMTNSVFQDMQVMDMWVAILAYYFFYINRRSLNGPVS